MGVRVRVPVQPVWPSSSIIVVAVAAAAMCVGRVLCFSRCACVFSFFATLLVCLQFCQALRFVLNPRRPHDFRPLELHSIEMSSAIKSTLPPALLAAKSVGGGGAAAVDSPSLVTAAVETVPVHVLATAPLAGAPSDIEPVACRLRLTVDVPVLADLSDFQSMIRRRCELAPTAVLKVFAGNEELSGSSGGAPSRAAAAARLDWKSVGVLKVSLPPIEFATAGGEGSAEAGSVSCDRDVLREFFYATEGANWVASDDWCTSSCVGQWFGISTNAKGRVNKVVMEDNGLVGGLPSLLAADTYNS